MTPEDVPQELIDILDRHAGRRHSRRGAVVTSLAEILTRYEEMRTSSDGEQILRSADVHH